MIRNLKDDIYLIISENRIKIIFVLTTFFVGIIWGSVICGMGSQGLNSEYTDNFFSLYNISRVSAFEIFLRSSFTYFKIFFIIWLSSKYLFLIFLNPVSVLSRGFALGYTIAYFTYSYGFKGILNCLLALILQNTLLVPVMILYSVFQLNYITEYAKLKNSGTQFKQLQKLKIKNRKISLCVILVVLLCGITDAYILPRIITFIS